MSPKSVILWQVYNLFRQLGLRHIFVVPRPSRVIGMITRKDLLLEVPDALITDDCWMPLLFYCNTITIFVFRKMVVLLLWNSNLLV